MPEKFDFSKIEDQKEFKNLPQEEKDNIVGEAQEEAETENFEKELSPEAIEKIMDKVQDVNEKGTAITALSLIGSDLEDGGRESVIKAIFKKGLLGTGRFESGGGKELSFVEHWYQGTRKGRETKVFCNIVGRDIKNIGEAYWMHSSEIGFIYDLSDYKELVPAGKYAKTKGLTNTYRADIGGVAERDTIRVILKALNIDTNLSLSNFITIVEQNKEKIINYIANQSGAQNVKHYSFRIDKLLKFYKENRHIEMEFSDDGFIVNFRVPNRKFKGVILKAYRERTPEEIKEFKNSLENNQSLDVDSFDAGIERIRTDDEGVVDHKVVVLLKNMRRVYGKETERLIPVYNPEGNLLWPKKMSYEEVKKFVAERDKKKEAKVQH